MSPRISAREKLLSAAAERFYADGLTATGIDAIIEAAHVTKMSLYNNFGSKAELVSAYIEQRHAQWLGLYQQRLDDSNDPKAGVLAVVDAYIDHAELGYAHGFRGCGLLNAAAELPAGHSGRASVARHKLQVEQILREHLARLTNATEAAQLAEHVSYLLEGAMSRSGLEGSPARLRSARAMVLDVLERV